MTPPRLHVDARGAGPALALAHGFGGSARNFRGQLRALSDSHRMIAWDARGHARSEAPSQADAYRLDALADDVGRVLDGEGIESAVVGGLSLGAATALAFARAAPGRVRGLVLASYPASRHGPGGGGFGRVAEAFADAIERDGLEAAGERFVWGPDSGLDERGRSFVRQGFLEHPPHALAHTLRGVLARLPEPVELVGALARSGLPLLLIAGGADPGSLAASREIQACWPEARLEVIPEAGHVVNLAAPRAFDAILRSFLESL